LDGTRDEPRRQTSPEGDLAGRVEAVKLREPAQRAEQSATPAERTSEAGGESVWERVFERKNLLRALKRVKTNGGAPGVDGMTVEALHPYLKAHPGPGRQDGLVGSEGRPLDCPRAGLTRGPIDPALFVGWKFRNPTAG
jgi:hypothetical protein